MKPRPQKARQHSGINKKGNASSNPDRKTNGKGGMRSKATIQRLNMYKGGKPIRDKKGVVTGGELLMSNTVGNRELKPNEVARIAPDRRWFGNTRTISQGELDKFREDMSTREADPYSVILRRKKIPMALLQDCKKMKSVNLLENESFEQTYGGNAQRKRPKLTEAMSDYASLMANASAKAGEYELNPNRDQQIVVDTKDESRAARRDDLFAKGQSKRIWAELYKVLDCSDVVLEIVDARNVPGTRCYHVERYIKKNPHKHLVIIINKCDLVPNWVTRRWVKLLSEEFPTVAFHAHLTKSFGKSALINLLRQFSKLHADKRQISVGCIGYPNVGKSSVINTMMGTACCKAAPVPGETKIWQYIALTKRISLIDCPGIVYNTTDDDEVETVLKGVVRAERLDAPVDFISAIVARVKPEYIQKMYNVPDWQPAPEDIGHNDNNQVISIQNRKAAEAEHVAELARNYKLREAEEEEKGDTEPAHIQLLNMIALKMGKLLKGGEPDIKHIAVIMINDWQRGKLPYFVAPPRADKEEEESDDEEEDDGELEEEEEEEDDDEEEDAAAAAVGTIKNRETESMDQDDDDDEAGTGIAASTRKRKNMFAQLGEDEEEDDN